MANNYRLANFIHTNQSIFSVLSDAISYENHILIGNVRGIYGGVYPHQALSFCHWSSLVQILNLCIHPCAPFKSLAYRHLVTPKSSYTCCHSPMWLDMIHVKGHNIYVGGFSAGYLCRQLSRSVINLKINTGLFIEANYFFSKWG